MTYANGDILRDSNLIRINSKSSHLRTEQSVPPPRLNIKLNHLIAEPMKHKRWQTAEEKWQNLKDNAFSRKGNNAVNL